MEENEGQRGGWIPVLKHKGKPETERNMDSLEVFTVFVDNLPCSLDPKGLFNLFRKFGVVKDVFIRQKRRRITNTRFGFVRYSCEVAAKVVVQKAHGLWVDDKKLGVKFAEFERNKEHVQTHIQPPKQSKHRVEVKRGPNPFTNKKSFAEVVQGTKVVSSGSVSVKVEVCGNGWLYDSVVVRLKARYVNISLKIELEERGIEGIAVRKCGGRDAVLSFKTKEERETKMKAIKNIIEDWCELIIQWQPELVLEPERLVWITCYGIPLHLWNRSNLIKIGSLWGEVLEGEECILQSFDCGKLRIITKCMEPINKVIHLETKQFSYPVRVLEDQIVVTKISNSAADVRNLKMWRNITALMKSEVLRRNLTPTELLSYLKTMLMRQLGT